MDSYNSKYTGIQVDNAVAIALGMADTLNAYVKHTDINISVAGLSDGLIAVSQLPITSKNNHGILLIGNGLLVDSEGKVDVDETYFCTVENVDNKILKFYQDTQIELTVDSLSKELENLAQSVIDLEKNSDVTQLRKDFTIFTTKTDSNINGITEDITNITYNYTLLNTRLSDTINRYDREFVTTNSNISDITAELINTNNSIITLRADLESGLQNVYDTISGLSTSTSDSITAINEELSQTAKKNEVSALQKQVDALSTLKIDIIKTDNLAPDNKPYYQLQIK